MKKSDTGTPHFAVDIRPRCAFATLNPDGLPCGELAEWVRPTVNGFPQGYFCGQHRAESDEPIPDSYLVNRVSIRAEIVFSGVGFSGPAARAEAIERLRLAVEGARGVMNLIDATSTIGRVTTVREVDDE